MADEKDKLSALQESLSELARTVTSHLKREDAPRKSWTQLAVEAGPGIAKLIGFVATVWLGMSAYDRAQLLNQKVSILERFIPHIAPDSVTEPTSTSSVDRRVEQIRYLQQTRESQRRYAALVALSQYSDRNLLFQMAVQYPKEGLDIAVDLVHRTEDGWFSDESTKDKLEEVDRRLIQRIISQQKSALFVLESQVKNLSAIVEGKQQLGEGLGHLVSAFGSPEMKQVQLEESRYRTLHVPLRNFAVAMALDIAVVEALSNAESEPREAQLDAIRDLTSLAPILVATLVSPENRDELLKLLDAGTVLGKAAGSASFITNWPLIKHAVTNKGEATVEKSVRDFFQGLVRHTASSLLKAIKKKGLPDKDDLSVLLMPDLLAIQKLKPGQTVNSLDIVTRAIPVAPTAANSANAQLLLRSLLRFVHNHIAILLQRTKRHQGWISAEIHYIQETGEQRLAEIERLIKKGYFSKEALKEIAVKIATVYAGIILYGWEIKSHWEEMQRAFKEFIQLAGKAEPTADELKDMKTKLGQLVTSADKCPGRESRELVEVCVALYDARSGIAALSSENSEDSCCRTGWLVALIGAVLFLWHQSRMNSRSARTNLLNAGSAQGNSQQPLS